MKKHHALGLLVCLMSMQIWAQPIQMLLPKVSEFRMDTAPAGFDLRILHLESGDAFSKSGFLNATKVKHAKQFGVATRQTSGMRQKITAQDPLVHDDFGMKRVFAVNGMQVPLPGGTPNDNTIAISNDSILLAGVNSFIWGWDLKQDTFLFAQQFISLIQASGLPTNSYASDPRLHYDPVEDRFVLLFFVGNNPQTSQVFVCFSETNDPRDGWHGYSIPGNPLNNNRWSDFPAITVTEDKLILSINLIIPGVSWQVGFDGSIIWEMDKHAGYAGDSLPVELHHGITYGGEWIRNLHAITGWNGSTTVPMFMSNRNFSAQNDSVFFLRRNDSAVGGTHSYDIHLIHASEAYGLPPNGVQPSTPTGQLNKGMQTNDARWLGGMEMPDGSVHVVSTTREFSSQRSAIYHGILHNPLSPDTLYGHVIGDNIKYFGYPNLAFIGNEECDGEVLIGFNHTSPVDYPGFSALYYGNDGTYSNVISLKSGLGNVNKLGGAERWGDYFGIQSVYNDPQQAWLAGFYGLANGSNSTWFSLLESPDSTRLDVQVDMTGVGCEVEVSAIAIGGVPPYNYAWDSNPGIALAGPYCSGDSVSLSVTDARGCQQALSVYVPYADVKTPSVFPNPTQDMVLMAFDAPSGGEVSITLTTLNGQVITVGKRPVKAGRNEAQLWLGHLPAGTYHVRIHFGDQTGSSQTSHLLSEKLLLITSP